MYKYFIVCYGKQQMMFIVAFEQFTYCERKTQDTVSYRWDGLRADWSLSLLSYAFALGYLLILCLFF